MQPTLESTPRPNTQKHHQPTASEILYDMSWDQILPLDLGYDAKLTKISLNEALTFTKENHKRIFNQSQQSPFAQEIFTRAKLAYYTHFVDCFGILYENQMVGVMLCNPVDWSTYYIRYFAVLPEHQSLGFCQKSIQHLFRIFKDLGVQRIEGETSPSNRVVVHFLTKLGFMMTGSQTTDRWGVLLRYTCYLDPMLEKSFARHYSAHSTTLTSKGDAS